MILIYLVVCICNVSSYDPYVSFVFTFQPGTYGDSTNGKHVERTATFRFVRQLNWIAENAARSNVSVEVVVSMWPVSVGDNRRKENLFESLKTLNLTLPANLEHLQLIYVTHEAVNSEIQHIPNDLHVLEYYGKNIAGRRSKGKVLVLGGTDCLPHEKFFDWLALKQIRHDAVYGMHRVMLNEDIDPTIAELDNLIKERTRIIHTGRVSASSGSLLSSYAVDVDYRVSFSNSAIYNAAGDFTMISRDGFLDVRGYVELPHREHVDSLFIYQCRANGKKLLMFDEPITCFHQHHDRGQSIIGAHPIDANGHSDSFVDIERRGVFGPMNRRHMWGMMDKHLRTETIRFGKLIKYK